MEEALRLSILTFRSTLTCLWRPAGNLCFYSGIVYDTVYDTVDVLCVFVGHKGCLELTTDTYNSPLGGVEISSWRSEERVGVESFELYFLETAAGRKVKLGCAYLTFA